MKTVFGTSAAFFFAAAMALSQAGAALAQTAREIGLGETLRGELQDGDATAEGAFYDVYEFQAIAGQSFVVVLDSDEFDPIVRVSGPGGLSDENDDAEEGSLGSRLEFTVPASGVISIRPTSYDAGESGRYSLTLQAGAVVRNISFGETLSGELTPDSAMHNGMPSQSFVFRGQEDQSLTIRMESNDFDSYLILRRAGSSQDLMTDDDSGGDLNSQIIVRLPETGTYEILANALTGEIGGRFSLTLQDGVETRRPDAQSIAYGRVLRTNLTTGAGLDSDGLSYDVYTFRGRRGDEVTITAVSNEFDTILFLGEGADPESWLATNDDLGDASTDSEIEATLPRDGTYEVHVVSYVAGQVGSYMLGLSSE